MISFPSHAASGKLHCTLVKSHSEKGKPHFSIFMQIVLTSQMCKRMWGTGLLPGPQFENHSNRIRVLIGIKKWAPCCGNPYYGPIYTVCNTQINKKCYRFHPCYHVINSQTAISGLLQYLHFLDGKSLKVIHILVTVKRKLVADLKCKPGPSYPKGTTMILSNSSVYN